MSTKVWNLMYRAGAAGRVISAADNPVTRKAALEGAAVVTKNGWRVWVEHHKTAEIIYQNPAEMKYLQSLTVKQGPDRNREKPVVSFSVEREFANGQFSLIGYSDESGKSLNPCASLKGAKKIMREILEVEKSSASLAWKKVQIFKTTRVPV